MCSIQTAVRMTNNGYSDGLMNYDSSFTQKDVRVTRQKTDLVTCRVVTRPCSRTGWSRSQTSPAEQTVLIATEAERLSTQVYSLGVRTKLDHRVRTAGHDTDANANHWPVMPFKLKVWCDGRQENVLEHRHRARARPDAGATV